MIGQPRADHPGQDLGVQAGQAPADGGLGGHHPVVGCLAAGAQRRPHRLWGIRGPLGDRGEGTSAGQHRRGGHGQDRNQRMPPPTGRARVADGGQVGQQVRDVGVAERLSAIQLGERGRDRGG
jgi:hypothetical protein